jgi:hypothetical protein
MREAMKNSLSLKAGALLTTAFGIILVSGSVGDLTFAADAALPAGFKKGDLAPEPSADMIEAGKRVYFTGSMARAMDQAPIVSGLGHAISTRERSRFGIRPAASCRCSMPRNPFPVRMICLRL